LARWLVSHGYFDLQDRYGGMEPSDCTSVLMIVGFRDQRKNVMNYCGGGDEQTWEFEMMIRGVASALDQLTARVRRRETSVK
jgi:hypothetical protein